VPCENGYAELELGRPEFENKRRTFVESPGHRDLTLLVPYLNLVRFDLCYAELARFMAQCRSNTVNFLPNMVYTAKSDCFEHFMKNYSINVEAIMLPIL